MFHASWKAMPPMVSVLRSLGVHAVCKFRRTRCTASGDGLRRVNRVRGISCPVLFCAYAALNEHCEWSQLPGPKSCTLTSGCCSETFRMTSGMVMRRILSSG